MFKKGSPSARRKRANSGGSKKASSLNQQQQLLHDSVDATPKGALGALRDLALKKEAEAAAAAAAASGGPGGGDARVRGRSNTVTRGSGIGGRASVEAALAAASSAMAAVTSASSAGSAGAGHDSAGAANGGAGASATSGASSSDAAAQIKGLQYSMIVMAGEMGKVSSQLKKVADDAADRPRLEQRRAELQAKLVDTKKRIAALQSGQPDPAAQDGVADDTRESLTSSGRRSSRPSLASSTKAPASPSLSASATLATANPLRTASSDMSARAQPTKMALVSLPEAKRRAEAATREATLRRGAATSAGPAGPGDDADDTSAGAADAGGTGASASALGASGGYFAALRAATARGSGRRAAQSTGPEAGVGDARGNGSSHSGTAVRSGPGAGVSVNVFEVRRMRSSASSSSNASGNLRRSQQRLERLDDNHDDNDDGDDDENGDKGRTRNNGGDAGDDDRAVHDDGSNDSGDNDDRRPVRRRQSSTSGADGSSPHEPITAGDSPQPSSSSSSSGLPRPTDADGGNSPSLGSPRRRRKSVHSGKRRSSSTSVRGYSDQLQHDAPTVGPEADAERQQRRASLSREGSGRSSNHGSRVGAKRTTGSHISRRPRPEAAGSDGPSEHATPVGTSSAPTTPRDSPSSASADGSGDGGDGDSATGAPAAAPGYTEEERAAALAELKEVKARMMVLAGVMGRTAAQLREATAANPGGQAVERAAALSATQTEELESLKSRVVSLQTMVLGRPAAAATPVAKRPAPAESTTSGRRKSEGVSSATMRPGRSKPARRLSFFATLRGGGGGGGGGGEGGDTGSHSGAQDQSSGIGDAGHGAGDAHAETPAMLDPVLTAGQPWFGRPLDDVLLRERSLGRASGVPFVVEVLTDTLVRRGLNAKGIFRVAGSAALTPVLAAALAKACNSGAFREDTGGDESGSGAGGQGATESSFAGVDGGGLGAAAAAPGDDSQRGLVASAMAAASAAMIVAGESPTGTASDPGPLIPLLKRTDVHSCARALKNWLRLLPGPPFPNATLKRLLALARAPRPDLVSELKVAVAALPAPRRALLVHMVVFLRQLEAHSETNMMSASNLGIVFGQSLVSAPGPGQQSRSASIDQMTNVGQSIDVMTCMLEEADTVFGQTSLQRPDALWAREVDAYLGCAPAVKEPVGADDAGGRTQKGESSATGEPDMIERGSAATTEDSPAEEGPAGKGTNETGKGGPGTERVTDDSAKLHAEDGEELPTQPSTESPVGEDGRGDGTGAGPGARSGDDLSKSSEPKPATDSKRDSKSARRNSASTGTNDDAGNRRGSRRGSSIQKAGPPAGDSGSSGSRRGSRRVVPSAAEIDIGDELEHQLAAMAQEAQLEIETQRYKAKVEAAKSSLFASPSPSSSRGSAVSKNNEKT